MIKHTVAFSSFSVHDIAKAKEFYGTILGLKVVESKEGLELHFPTAMHIFVYPSQSNKPADFTILNFIVDDIEAEVDGLIAQGVAMEQYDMPPFIKTNEKGIAGQGEGRSIAWFKDPSGNILSLIQEK